MKSGVSLFSVYAKYSTDYIRQALALVIFVHGRNE